MWQQGEYVISTDKALLDFDVVHRYISSESYWGQGRSRETMEQAICNSVCFGLYHDDGDDRKQVGFARVVTDMVVFGYIMDLFVLTPHRGKGLGKWITRTIVEHFESAGVRKLALATKTPEFYLDAGFGGVDTDREFKLMNRLAGQ